MSLEKLPYDLFFLLLKDLQSYDLNYISTVKALRLTSRSLNLAATGALFESLHLSASHSKSWMKMEKIRQQASLVQNVRFLFIKREIYFESDINVRLDLASMPSLEEITIKTESRLSVIHFHRQRLVKNPEHRINLDFSRDKENRWARFISDLAKGALAYGCELDLLALNQDDFDHSFWISILPTIDLRYLRTLSVRLSEKMKSTDHQLMASFILPVIRSLPCLFHLIIHQGIPEDRKDVTTCDLFSMMYNYHWSSVRCIQIVEPPTTSLTSLKNFLLLYRGQLQHLALYGECPEMTIKDDGAGPNVIPIYDSYDDNDDDNDDDSDDDNYDDNDDDNYDDNDDDYDYDNDDDNSKWDRECGQVLQAWIEQEITPERFTIGSLGTWEDICWDMISFSKEEP